MPLIGQCRGALDTNQPAEEVKRMGFRHNKPGGTVSPNPPPPPCSFAKQGLPSYVHHALQIK